MRRFSQLGHSWEGRELKKKVKMAVVTAYKAQPLLHMTEINLGEL